MLQKAADKTAGARRVVIAPGPMSIPVPQDGNRQPTPRTPNRSPSHMVDTPATEPHS